MFDDNRAVMLQKELVQPCPITPRSDKLDLMMEAALRQFVTMLDEGDEVLLKSEIRGGHFYLSLVRGAHEAHRRFDPTTRDFGDPDVLPRDIISDELLKALVDDKGEASFDRFGRRPTYLSFRFPVSDEAPDIPDARPSSALAGLKILAIDDQQMILDLLSGICQSMGLELAAVRDPSEGLALFRQRRFDMVMVDLAIGRVSGWDIAREIKRISAETPVIMLTGWGVDIARDRAAEGSIDYALAKPFRIEQLTEIISRAGSRQISS
jgi:CheY-like chemotaxis protein